MQIQSVAIGWRIYDITHSAFSLGLVGLCQFVPIVLLTLPVAGDSRTGLIRGAYFSLCLDRTRVRRYCSMRDYVRRSVREIWPYYAVLLIVGASRGLAGPSSQSSCSLCSFHRSGCRVRLPGASSTFQVAVVVGPACGGLLYAFGPMAAFGASTVCFLIAGVGVTYLKAAPTTRIGAGYEQVPMQLCALPKAWLLSASVLLSWARFHSTFSPCCSAAQPLCFRPMRAIFCLQARWDWAAAQRAGFRRRVHGYFHWSPADCTACRAKDVSAGVVIFRHRDHHFRSLAEFLSQLSAMLAILGAADMVSVFVRQSLVQLSVPDAMRGRVSAVNVLFIGTSNELGEFESGLTAAWFGTVPSVVIGGVGTLVVVAVWMKLFPPLRHVDRLVEAKQ